MFLFIIAVLLWVIALGLVAGAFLSSKGRAGRAVGAAGAVVLGLVMFVVSGIKAVPAKDIGVPQSFGSVGSQVYGPGAHQTWTPWLHLTDVDETVQTTTFEGNNCLTVRIGGQQTACADVTIQWEIRPAAATALFKDYAHSGDLMATVTNAVIVREFKQVVNGALGDYNPITDVQTVTNTNAANSQFSKFGPQILQTMRADIGNQIEVRSVLLPFIHYDATVESKLAAIQQAFANFAIAQENVKVNQANSQAFKSLGTPSVNQLIAQCLNDAKENHTSPMGCFPGQASGLTIGK